MAPAALQLVQLFLAGYLHGGADPGFEPHARLAVAGTLPDFRVTRLPFRHDVGLQRTVPCGNRIVRGALEDGEKLARLFAR